MIGLMPRYVPRVRKKSLVLHKRSRKRPLAQREVSTFDHRPPEFPVATMTPSDARGRAIAMLAALQRWLLARWTWFKPRSIPCAIATLGMVGLIAAGDYLAHHMDQPAPKPHPVAVGLSK